MNNCVLEVKVITYNDIHLLINPMKRYQCQNSGGISAVFLSFGSRSRRIWNAIIQAVFHLEPGL